jgi:hypothetical protein
MKRRNNGLRLAVFALAMACLFTLGWRIESRILKVRTQVAETAKPVPPGLCVSAAKSVDCGSAFAGSIAVSDVGGTTVKTTALTLTSFILVNPDNSLGHRLGIDCSSTVDAVIAVVAVTKDTFTVRIVSQAHLDPPVCADFMVVN